MTVAKLDKVTQRPLKVMSGFNGKVLCHRFNEKKHPAIGAREVVSLWAEIAVINSGFSSSATATLCVYVNGHEEAAKRYGFSEVKADG